MKCSRCGKELKAGARYCIYCGAATTQEPEPAPRPTPKPPKPPKAAPSPAPTPSDPYRENQIPKIKPTPIPHKKSSGWTAGHSIAAVAIVIILAGVIGLRSLSSGNRDNTSSGNLTVATTFKASDVSKKDITDGAPETVNNETRTETLAENEENQTDDTKDTQAQETQTEESTALASNGEYILPGSDSRYISESELEGFTAEQCRLARNEIYARHGRKFDDASLQAYYSQFDWYTPTVDPKNFQESWLNQYEIANRDLIVAYETAHGYR